jgi:hypothetical protein
MNPIYLETRFKRDLENDPKFDMFEIFPDQFVIITAYATTGEEWSDMCNDQEDERLKEYLQSRFSCVKRITGYSPTTRHSEPGWLVNCSFDEGCDIGLMFKQDAIYWGENGSLFVSYCGPQRSKVWVLETALCVGVSEWGGS